MGLAAKIASIASIPHPPTLGADLDFDRRLGDDTINNEPLYLMMAGMVQEGLDIVRACRDRYDGKVRNPFNEYECGHWYARAMSSYALIQGMTGVW